MHANAPVLSLSFFMNIEHFDNDSKVNFSISSESPFQIQTSYNTWLSHQESKDSSRQNGIFIPYGSDMIFELKDDSDHSFNAWIDKTDSNIYFEDNKLVIE